jgi:hypothetical protein
MSGSANASSGFTVFSARIPASAVVDPYVYYYVQVTDGTQSATLPTNDPVGGPIAVAILPNVAPVISHSTLSGAVAGQSVNIDFTAEDVTNRVERATVFYRRAGTPSFTVSGVTSGTPVVVGSVTIPSATVTGAGLEYYIEAEDDFGSTASFGSASNPVQVVVSSIAMPAGQRDFGSLRIYANSFVDDVQGNTTASGNVQIGHITGAPILGISGSVVLDPTAQTVKPFADTLVSILNIKLRGDLPARNFQVFRGRFTIRAGGAEPALAMESGTSLFRLVGNLPFLFPFAENLIKIEDDKIVLEDASFQLTRGVASIFSIGNIELSQQGQSTSVLKVGTPPGTDGLPLGSSTWTLKELNLELDAIQGTVKGSASFSIAAFLAGDVGGTVGFQIEPFALNTFGVTLPLSSALKKLLSFPPPPQPVQVMFKSASVLVDNIATALPMSLTVGGQAKVSNSLFLDPIEEKIMGVDLLSGGVSVGVDTSLKVVLAGNLNLLESFELAAAKAEFSGSGAKLEGSVNLVQVLVGRLLLNAGVAGNYFELNGSQLATLQIPPAAPFIGGTRLASQQVSNLLRIGSSGIQKAEFTTSTSLFWLDVGIRLDITDYRDPDLFITAGNESFQVLSVDSDSPSIRALAVTNSISVPPGLDYIMIRVRSDQNVAPDFSLKLPGGGTLTAAGIQLDSADPFSTPNVGDAFFSANAAAGEAYYALRNPAPGSYEYTIDNDAVLGGFQVSLITSNQVPTLAFSEPTTGFAWDQSSPIPIVFQVTDPEDEPVVDLYFDTDTSGNDGSPIAQGLLSGQVSSYNWEINQNALSSGTYFVYARVDDGVNAPVFFYNSKPIALTNPLAPATPTNLQLTPGEGQLTLSWDPILDADLVAYRVLLSRTAGDGYYEISASADRATQYTFENLASGVTYELAVISVNEATLESAPSMSLTGAPTGDVLESGSDLTFDLLGTTLLENADEADLSVTVNNEGGELVYSYRVSVYFGGLTDAHKVGEVLGGEIPAGGVLSHHFTFSSLSVASVSDQIYVKIEDVILPDTNPLNNVLVIDSQLPLNSGGDVGLIVSVDPASLTPSGALEIDLQTGYFEHRVTVSNSGSANSGPLRLDVAGLPPGVGVSGATGVDPATGAYFIIFNEGIDGNTTVEFILNYIAPDRALIFNDDLSVTVVQSASAEPTPLGAPISAQLSLQASGSSIVMLFSGVEPGRTYYLQYSPDLVDWTTSPVPFVSLNTQLQIVDSGPPLTPTAPVAAGEVPARFYRLISE